MSEQTAQPEMLMEVAGLADSQLLALFISHRDEAAFTEMELAYRQRSQNQFNGVMANFLRYLVTEDQLFCRIPDHESYRGQAVLLKKLEATARKFEAFVWY